MDSTSNLILKWKTAEKEEISELKHLGLNIKRELGIKNELNGDFKELHEKINKMVNEEAQTVFTYDV